MKQKAKSVIFIAAAVLSLFASCNRSGPKSNDAGEWITVKTAARYDYVEIIRALNSELEKDHIRVEHRAYESVNLNDLLIAGDIDLNLAQHYAALRMYQTAAPEKYNQIQSIGDIHISTLDLYSRKYRSAAELPNGAIIAIPNDVTNGGRALRVLARNGLITLKPGHSELPTTEEILLNPRNLKFTEITQAMMIQVLDDVAAGFAYSVNAVDAGLNPLVDPILKDAIDFEKNQDQHNFIIIFSALVTQANNETYRKVVNAYHTPAVARAYKQYYLGAITPVIDSRTVDLSRY